MLYRFRAERCLLLDHNYVVDIAVERRGCIRLTLAERSSPSTAVNVRAENGDGAAKLETCVGHRLCSIKVGVGLLLLKLAVDVQFRLTVAVTVRATIRVVAV